MGAYLDIDVLEVGTNKPVELISAEYDDTSVLEVTAFEAGVARRVRRFVAGDTGPLPCAVPPVADARWVRSGAGQVVGHRGAIVPAAARPPRADPGSG